jgi:inosose dehydratase
MVQFDEASGIPDPIWQVTEGFFTDMAPLRLWLSISNPRRNTGRFFDCFHKDRSFWDARYVDSRTVEGVELTERRIRFAHRWFGVSVVVSGAGQPADAAERRTVIEHLRRLGETAGSLGVTVALETHKGPTQNADAMLALMAEVDHPHVRLNFDTGNIAYYNQGVDPAAELGRVAHLVRNVHLKDNRGGFEDWYFPAVGDGGAVDFVRVRQVLDSVGFRGSYTIEIEGIGGEPEPGLEGRVERVRRSVEHLKRCGYFD